MKKQNLNKLRLDKFKISKIGKGSSLQIRGGGTLNDCITTGTILTDDSDGGTLNGGNQQITILCANTNNAANNNETYYLCDGGIVSIADNHHGTSILC